MSDTENKNVLKITITSNEDKTVFVEANYAYGSAEYQCSSIRTAGDIVGNLIENWHVPVSH